MSRIVHLGPKLTPMSISEILKQRKISHFHFLGRLDEKRAAATPLIAQFCLKLNRTCVKDKTKSHQVWPS